MEKISARRSQINETLLPQNVLNRLCPEGAYMQKWPIGVMVRVPFHFLRGLQVRILSTPQASFCRESGLSASDG